MSKLREARELLAVNGVTHHHYHSDVSGCYCSIGALNMAYSGDPDGPAHDLVEAEGSVEGLPENALSKRLEEYGEDIRRLYWAITGEEMKLPQGIRPHQKRHVIEEWNDRQFDQAWQAAMNAVHPGTILPADDIEVVRNRATANVLEVWDRALQRLAADEHTQLNQELQPNE